MTIHWLVFVNEIGHISTYALYNFSVTRRTKNNITITMLFFVL